MGDYLVPRNFTRIMSDGRISADSRKQKIQGEMFAVTILDKMVSDDCSFSNIGIAAFYYIHQL